MRIGALFAGYGGLEMGVTAALGGDVAWYSEIDKGALKILTHRYPDTPNIGDVTTVKWTPDCPTCGEPLALYDRDVPEGRGYYCPRDGWFDLDIRFADPDAARIPDPIDILTGGSPCQDLSHAGKRVGMTEGTRSNLWVAMREAIAVLQPSLVVWENVGGAASAEADSDLEPCPGCMGDPGHGGTSLRALGRVVGDLSSLGYVGCVRTLRAVDVGAPHGRLRYFLAAHPAGDQGWLEHGDGGAAADTGGIGHRESTVDSTSGRTLTGVDEGGETVGAGGPLLPTPAAYDGDRGGPQHPDKRRDGGHAVTLQDAVHGLLPTPRATDGTKDGPNQRGSSGDLMLPSAVTLLPTPSVSDGTGGHLNRSGDRSDELLLPGVAKQLALLPTPAVNDMGAAYTPDEWDEWTDRMKAEHGNGNGHGKSLSIEAARLLQTPSVADGTGGHETRGGARSDEPLLNGQAKAMHGSQWGDYADAIARWEMILGRPAPAPTMTSSKGNPQLSPVFVEWMMGLPAGWVTDTPGITRNEALKALGNGVVPQQAEAALRHLLNALAVAA
jgi:DNA (cytosine-5)-methyltransferase 1